MVKSLQLLTSGGVTRSKGRTDIPKGSSPVDDPDTFATEVSFEASKHSVGDGWVMVRVEVVKDPPFRGMESGCHHRDV